MEFPWPARLKSMLPLWFAVGSFDNAFGCRNGG